MPSLIRKLFHKSEAPNDGLTQPQREAIVDLLNYCMYADNLIFLAEDRVITDTVAKFNWDPKVPFDQFDVRSIGNARNATENQGHRDRFLASIRDRLGTAAVKGQALDLCQELFLADGARRWVGETKGKAAMGSGERAGKRVRFKQQEVTYGARFAMARSCQSARAVIPYQ